VGLTRYGILLPTVPIAKVFHVSQVTYYAIPIAGGMLLAACLYLLGERLAGRHAGVIAVVLLLTDPIVLTNLTRGYPDLPAVAVTAAALVTAVLAGDAWQERGASPALTCWLLATGFFLGWAYEIRETAVLGFPVVAVVLAARLPFRRWLITTTLPVLAWVGLELLISWLAYGDPLTRYKALFGASLGDGSVPADVGYLGKSRWEYLLIAWRTTQAQPGGSLLLVLAVAALVLGALTWRRSWVPLVWLVTTAGSLLALGGVWRPRAPSIRLDVVRYFLAFLPALSLLAAVGLVTALVWATGRIRVPSLARIAMAVPVALVLAASTATAGWVVSQNHALAPSGGTAFEQLRGYFEKHSPRVPVWSDWDTNRVLPAYRYDLIGQLVWNARLVSLAPGRWPHPGDLVVVVPSRDTPCFFCSRQQMAIRKEDPVLLPTRLWRRVWTSSWGNLDLYQVLRGPARGTGEKARLRDRRLAA
jgi:hypothetical protein